MSVVSFVRAEGIDSASMKAAIGKSLDLIQFSPEKLPRKIVIKPNLCYYYDYSTGETTNPRFVGALIDVLREKLSSNLYISIVESDASAVRCRHAFKMLGYEKLSKEKDVTLINLSEEKCEQEEVTINNFPLKFLVPRILRESDFMINVPKIKYQLGVKITCALKNMYGCNAYPKKYVYHKALAEAIVSMNKLIKSNLVVLDGSVVNGTVTKRLGLVMASRDPVAIDAAASRIIGLNPKDVKHIALAQKEGIGNVHFVPVGENPNHIRELFPRKKLKDNIRGFLASAYMRYMK